MEIFSFHSGNLYHYSPSMLGGASGSKGRWIAELKLRLMRILKHDFIIYGLHSKM